MSAQTVGRSENRNLAILIEKLQQLVQDTPLGHSDHVGYRLMLGRAFTQRYTESGTLEDLNTALQNNQAAVDLAAGQPDQDRVRCLQQLGMSFKFRYMRLGDLHDLESALETDQAIMDLTPEGHPQRAGRLASLAEGFKQRYARSEDMQDLETAIHKEEEVLSLTPIAHPGRVSHLQSLAALFGARYQKLGNLDDLEAALGKYQEIVNLVPGNDRADALEGLATCFGTRYHRLGDLNDLQTALQMGQQAVDLTPANHPNLAERLQSLATGFANRYQRLGDLNDLNSALQKFQEAVDMTGKNDPDRLRYLQMLAAALKDRYQRLGALDDLTSALQIDQEVVDFMSDSDNHPDRAGHFQTLAMSLTYRYQRLGDLKDLESAVHTFQKAVDLTAKHDPNKATCLQHLAVALKDRYHRLGDQEDLEAALKNEQEAVDLTHVDHPDKAEYLRSLAVSYKDRYRRWGDLKDLEAAMENDQEALALIPENHPERAGCLQSLAVSFGIRYEKLGDIKDLEFALKQEKEALCLIPADHLNRAGCLRNLAASYKSLYQRLGDLKDLESALQKDQEALAQTPTDHPDRAKCLQSLAASLIYRYRRLQDVRDIKAALQNNREAVDLTPEKHRDRAERLQNLAVCFTGLYQEIGDLQNLEAALQNDQEALALTPEDHPNRPGCLQNLAVSFKHRYMMLKDPKDLEAVHTHYSESFKAPTRSTPEQCWRAALSWATFSEEFQPIYCSTAYSAAFQLLPEILWIGHTIPVRHNVIHRLEIDQATSNATKTCIKLCNLRSAVEIVEQGLAITFQQIFQLKPDVDKLSPQDAESLHKLSSELYSGTADDPSKVARQRNDLLDKIRKETDPHFLRPKPYSVLCHASTRGPVVIFNSHEDSCDGILIPSPNSEPVHIPLPNVTLDLLKSKQVILKQSLGGRNRGESESTRLFARREGSKTSKECFEEMLPWLWMNVVSLVYDALKSVGIHDGRLWLLPTGSFTGLPLHASPPTDQFVHSYAVTLGSLLETHLKESSNVTQKLGVVGVTHTGPGKMNHLKGVEREVAKICSVVGTTNLQCLMGEQATPEAVRLQLENSSWVHLACHGKQDLVEPTKSHLLLYGGILDLETILKMPLSNAQCIVLAACQTAMGDSELSNEFFHLGGGFIAAGFQGVIGTLWSMDDADGPLVAEIFYSHLFGNGSQPQASDAAEALQLAVKQLKTRNVSYERWIPFIHLGV
ncbi:CHAT domain-containing protein [Mycena vulgaris]|nr:CHAT domain-containing protein [Mycena vulgaris]